MLSWKTIEWLYTALSQVSGNIRYFAFVLAFASDGEFEFVFVSPGRLGERVVNAIRSDIATTNSGVHASRKVYEQTPNSC